MTKFLFHGDHLSESRSRLVATVAEYKTKGFEIRYLDGSKITPAEFESNLATANLFSEEALVIENLFSRPVSADRKKLFTLVKSYAGPKDLLFWEKKEVTKANLANLGSSAHPAKIFLSKTPAIIFAFLDSLSPDSLSRSLDLMHQCAVSSEDGFIFVMLARHLADLIVAKSGDTSDLNPWKKGKLVSQAQLWDLSTLISLHSSLLSIDRSVKTGTTKLSYLDHLDLLLARALG